MFFFKQSSIEGAQTRFRVLKRNLETAKVLFSCKAEQSSHGEGNSNLLFNNLPAWWNINIRQVWHLHEWNSFESKIRNKRVKAGNANFIFFVIYSSDAPDLRIFSFFLKFRNFKFFSPNRNFADVSVILGSVLKQLRSLHIWFSQ